LGAMFQASCIQLRRALRARRLEMIRKQSWSRFLAMIVGLIVVALSLGWMGWRMLHGSATLGDLTIFYTPARN
jgi:hypothetical protein